jgi:MYXO-CTERM domain-containing protein
LRFRVGSDPAVGDDGWDLDNLSFQGITNKPFATIGADDGVCVDPSINDAFDEGNGGCGCQTGGRVPLSGLLWLAIVLPLLRRRRRR